MFPTSEASPPTPPPRGRPRHRRSAWSLRLTPGGIAILLGLNLAILGLIAWFFFQVQVSGIVQAWLPSQPAASPSLVQTSSPFPSLTPSATQPTPSLTPSPFSASPTPVAYLENGLLILSMTEGVHSHLFVYQPQVEPGSAALSLARLTDGPWDDRSPAISPDGKSVAFASNRNGYWDIYLLELASGRVERLTDSLEYDGAPAWSPDGVWVVYESYVDDNLEIFIRNISTLQESIRLTNNSAADYSPAWSPQGRQIAFVSNRSGEPEIWLADLDQADENLFVDVSQSKLSLETHPTWAKDGNSLAWAAVQDGFHSLMRLDLSSPGQQPTNLGSGDWPVWSPDGATLLTALVSPTRHYLTAYPAGQPGLVLPLMDLPGFITGLDWGQAELPIPLGETYRQAFSITPTPLWLPELTSLPDAPAGRYQVVPLEDVQAPHAFLQDSVDESFRALRQYVGRLAGWDLLSSLENAFVPLTVSLDPGMGQDWLYTGRAFTVNTAPLNASWLAVVREDFGVQTYWRVYMRARYQDGSAGMPLTDQPWDFTKRYGSNTTSYELGGAFSQAVPPGYWLDLTQAAAAFGWQRQPALPLWRASFPAARFNEFVLAGGLDWQAAMSELYPPEALITPSPIIPPTRTVSPTPRWYQSPTPTATFTPRSTFTASPPSETPTQTPSAPPSATPTPSPTKG